MITQNDAEALANKVVQDYVNTCNCETEEDMANVLMKLFSMCGLAMVAVSGHSEGVARMVATVEYICNRNDSFTKSTVQ